LQFITGQMVAQVCVMQSDAQPQLSSNPPRQQTLGVHVLWNFIGAATVVGGTKGELKDRVGAWRGGVGGMKVGAGKILWETKKKLQEGVGGGVTPPPPTLGPKFGGIQFVTPQIVFGASRRQWKTVPGMV